MLLTISTTHRPAGDLGYLLHKNPARVQSFTQSFGMAHVFYPEVAEERCTAALLLSIDPVGLVRNRRAVSAGSLSGHYVNDRPYAVNSFFSVAIGDVFRSALNGRCADRPELVDQALPLEVHVPVMPVRGGESVLRNLFEPLGYQVLGSRLPLDARFPSWGESAYFDVRLSVAAPLQRVLEHLYVLIPVLDNEKHYWVGDDEIEKLLRHGERWLAGHPGREEIVRRYLKHKRSLARAALERLMEADGVAEEDAADEPAAEIVRGDAREQALERGLSLNEQRLQAVLGTLESAGASSVLDLGCGEGRLLRLLIRSKQFTRVTGLDVSHRALDIAWERMHLDRLPSPVRDKLTLLHGSLMYRDERLAGYDAAAAVEVIEHLDEDRLGAFERVLFQHARPRVAVITTPNREYNVRFERLGAGQFRHADHRFEWTRAQFGEWGERQADRFGYMVEHRGVGEADPELGAPTQLAIFTRVD